MNETARPSSVYRMYDKSGELIYVGLTDRGHQRRAEHLATKPWAWQVAETQWEHFDTREKAATRERELIQSQHPRHNVLHRDPEGEPERIEFRLLAQQYDLLATVQREVVAMRAEFNTFSKDFEARAQALEKAARVVLVSVRTGRPLNDQEGKVVVKYLAYLDMMNEHRDNRRRKAA